MLMTVCISKRYNSTHVLIYDPETNEVANSKVENSKVDAGEDRWFGGVESGGIMYGIPMQATQLLIYNPKTNVASGSSQIPQNIRSLYGYGWSAGVAFDGKIYGIPYFAAHVLIYNIENDKITGSLKVPDSIAVKSGYQWSGGVVFRNKIYGIPRNAKHVLIYDPETNLVTGSEKVPALLGAAGGWSGGVTINNMIYGIPSNANHVLIYNPLTDKVTGSAQIPSAMDDGGIQWIGGVLIQDKIYGVPNNADSIIIYDPFDPVGGQCVKDGGCSSGKCQTHCCNVEEIKVDHLSCPTACGGKAVNGSCYPTLELEASSASSPSAWDAAKVAALGWPERMNMNEPVFFAAPPAGLIRKAVARTVFPHMPSKSKDVDGSNLKFKLRWLPQKENGDNDGGGGDDGGGERLREAKRQLGALDANAAAPLRDALLYLRGRVGVPRDMDYAAARQLRAHLTACVDALVV